MPDLEVRPARPNDASGVAVLLEDAVGRAAGLRGGPALLEALGAEDPAALSSAVCAESAAPLSGMVALLEDEVVGVAVLRRDGAEATVDLVAVHVARSLRRRRIGSALLEAATALARSEGKVLEALALPGDQSTKSLLEAGGFKARLLRKRAER